MLRRLYYGTPDHQPNFNVVCRDTHVLYARYKTHISFYKQDRYHAFVHIGEHTWNIFVLNRLLLFDSLQAVHINSV